MTQHDEIILFLKEKHTLRRADLLILELLAEDFNIFLQLNADPDAQAKVDPAGLAAAILGQIDVSKKLVVRVFVEYILIRVKKLPDQKPLAR